ncbi:Nucleoside-diphosphate-sugar epimerase [Arboricoccus pini]|uniref:Nucleoside-diphosphate-sugar epimerase n=1 Tax=Arboricoccus pini TaxID=1963835 RepID=A0A212QQD3_9PROT|nr:NAD(P)-dependent oxidoreductase [Arboricoccus pini]SNB61697.1 Nucleoside-diphosphate-sugar epimerase [Arboricoccus pini]
MIIALTGATGFIGRPLLTRLLDQGHKVKALARHPESLPPAQGLVAVKGDLGNAPALAELVADAESVIHLAGLVAAADPTAFEHANAAGSRNLAAALASANPSVPLLVISSLAARAPELSPYAASKAGGERAFAGLPDVRIVRPPAVYGPGDKGTLPIFQQLSQGWLTAPRGRHLFSMIHVDDLVALLAALAVGDAGDPARLIEPDDGTDAGYGWDDLARIAALAMGRRVRVLKLPRAVFEGVARLMELAARGLRQTPPLDRGKVAELFHPDWRVERATHQGLIWRPTLDFTAGFARTLAWYRSAGWIKAGKTK